MTTANVRSQLDRKLRDAFRDIIEGKTVKRCRHELVYGGIDVTNVFIEELEKKNFLPATVGDISVREGERVPAFYVDGTTAYFGWIFWEKFTQLRLRKLFGSEVRNEKGDWQIQIPPSSPKIIYANAGQILAMDIDHPFEI
jgi:hypothetical protein